jgi:hypothetical protein
MTPTKAPDGTQVPPQWTQIPVWQWNMLRQNVQTFETIFNAEMQNATTYVVPRRGLYSTPALVNEAETAFHPDVAAAIPAKAKADFHEAGRCMAFSLPTAAGFHACRAVEGMLEVYYQIFTGRADTLNGWNDYIVELKKITTQGKLPAPEGKTLHNLSQIKDFDRNPLAHPRQTLSDIDARILFGQAEIVILAMAQETTAARQQQAAAQQTFPLPAPAVSAVAQ